MSANPVNPAVVNADQNRTLVDLQMLTRVKPVPVLADGAHVLLNVLSDTTLSFDKLAAGLESFPSIVGRLLSLANSPWSSPATPVTSLDTAVARLGVDAVRTISIALTMSAPFNPGRCAAFDPHRYWCSALLAADAAAAIALKTRSSFISPAAARTCGLMHNIGLLWLADALPEETCKALEITGADPATSVNDALIESCGFSYSDAGAVLSAAWKMPQPIATGMTYHIATSPGSTEDKIARLIKLVAAMVSSVYAESAAEIDAVHYEDLSMDFATYVQLYDDLTVSLPGMRELATTLFG